MREMSMSIEGRAEQRINQHMVQQLRQIENRRLAEGMIISLTRRRAQEYLNQIASPIYKGSPIKNMDQRECTVRLVVGKLAEQFETLLARNPKLWDGKGKDPKKGLVEEIHTMVDEQLPFAVDRQTYARDWKWEKGDEQVQRWREACDNDPLSMDSSELAAISTDPDHVEVLPIGPKDLADAEEFYEQYRLTLEDAMRLIMGEKDTTPQTFVKRFAGNEKVQFSELLSQTRGLWSRGPQTREEKKKKKTMYGFGLKNKVRNLWEAMVFLEVLPQNLEDDPDCMQHEMEFMRGGASGGGLRYSEESDSEQYEKAVWSGNMVRVALIMSRAKGALRRTMKTGVENLLAHDIVDDNTAYTAYALHSLCMAAQGFPVNDPQMAIGKNIASANSLNSMGIPQSSGVDQYMLNTREKIPPAEHHVMFPVAGDKKLFVWPRWAHFHGVGRLVHQSLEISPSSRQDKPGQLPPLLSKAY